MIRSFFCKHFFFLIFSSTAGRAGGLASVCNGGVVKTDSTVCIRSPPAKAARIKHMSSSVVVGFDLDMTLVDSAAGIAACMTHVLAARGVTHVSREEMVATIGMPLDQALGLWVPADALQQCVMDYREAFPTVGLPHVNLLPGALETLECLRTQHCTLLLISSRQTASVHTILDKCGIASHFSVVEGSLFGEGKGHCLRKHQADLYIGDHPGDVQAAITAQCYCAAVASGPTLATDLTAAGADTVLPDLTGFPAFFNTWRARRQRDDVVAR
jgi:phosphoglycolate phosphatase-like HAD superfamily hydrolase